VELQQHEVVSNTSAAVVAISANPLLPILDRSDIKVSNRAAGKKTGVSSAKASSKRKALQEKHSVGNAVLVTSPVDRISAAELDTDRGAGTSNSGISLTRELSGLVKSVFKRPVLDLFTKSGNKNDKNIDYCSSSEDISNGETSTTRAVTRSTRTKGLAETEFAANRSKSIDNSHKKSNETRTEVASIRQTNKSSSKPLSNANIRKESSLKKSSTMLQSRPISSQRSSRQASNGKTKSSQSEKDISTLLQPNISECASICSEPSGRTFTIIQNWQSLLLVEHKYYDNLEFSVKSNCQYISGICLLFLVCNSATRLCDVMQYR